MKKELCVFGMIAFTMNVLFADAVDEQIKHDFSLLEGSVEWVAGSEFSQPDSSVCKILKCREIDELGGQIRIGTSIVHKASVWVDENFSAVSKYYLTQQTKRALAIDQTTKRRQDCVMNVIVALRRVVEYGYAQCLAYSIPVDGYRKMAIQYGNMMKLREWKTIGDRQQTNAKNSMKKLYSYINSMHQLNLNVYDKIITKKLDRYNEFAARHPQLAQTALACQRAKKAEKIARDALERAENAESVAASMMNFQKSCDDEDEDPVYWPAFSPQRVADDPLRYSPKKGRALLP